MYQYDIKKYFETDNTINVNTQKSLSTYTHISIIQIISFDTKIDTSHQKL